MSGKHHFGGRTAARSQALQLLFQAEAGDRSVVDVLDEGPCLETGPLDDYGRELALGVEGMLDELDAVIAARSAGWDIDRMPAVDRNLLRIALYEMLKVDEVDVAVAIDECVELEKAYGTEESPRFANGLLGLVADQLDAGKDPVEVARQQLRAKGKHVPGEFVAVEDTAADLEDDTAVEGETDE